MKQHVHRGIVALGVGVFALSASSMLPSAAAAKAKANGSCKAVGAKEGNLICVAKGRKKVWQAAPAATVAPTAVAGASPAPASGPKPVPGFDGKTISLAHLGNVASGPFAVGGKALTAGFLAYMNDLNEKGGIAGKYKVNTIFAETEYSPDVASQKYAELKDKTVMVSQIYGTPLVVALAAKLKQDNVVGSPISLDAAWARDESYLPIGGAYQFQAINVLDWVYNNAGGKGKKFCAAAHTGPYGDTGVEGFGIATKKLGVDTGPIVRFAAGEPNMAAVVSQLKEANCGVVLLAEASAQTTGLIVNGAQNGYNPTFVGLSPSFDKGQVNNSTEALYTKQFFCATDAGEWGDAAIPGMAAAIASVKKNAPQYAADVNGAFIWGYVQAKTVAAVLEKAAALGDFSRDGIKAAMTQTGRVNLDALMPEYDYGPVAGRTPSTASYIMKVDASVLGRLTYATSNKPFSSPLTAGYKNPSWK